MNTEATQISQLNLSLKEKFLSLHHRPGIFNTAIPNLNLSLHEDVNCMHKCFDKPLVGLVLQGTKHSTLGGHDFVYSQNQSLVASVDMPISSYIVSASKAKPFLFIYLYLDKIMLADLVKELPWDNSDKENPEAVSICDTNADIMEMFLRLLNLSSKPEQIAMRAPMMVRELYYLLLLSPHGKLLRQINTPGTKNHQVAFAVNWLKENYKEDLAIENLAKNSHMSKANLYRNFKLFTGLSPLQYQKQLRLYEARRQIVTENKRILTAALDVGYESISQFNREYKRLFGEPPLRDLNKTRAEISINN